MRGIGYSILGTFSNNEQNPEGADVVFFSVDERSLRSGCRTLVEIWDKESDAGPPKADI
jgi:hypothetical protein